MESFIAQLVSLLIARSDRIVGCVQVLPTGVVFIESMGKRIVVCDAQESVFFLKYKVCACDARFSLTLTSA